ncbi:peptidylprolyl isomerase [Patescibacteria group bacterium]|nr:peptidylprolyl isomerase [Patescibacteria group bacterium]
MKRRHKHTLLNCLLLVLAVLLFFMAQPYILPGRSVIGRNILQKVGLPAGFAGWHPVSLSDYYMRLQTAKAVNGRQDAGSSMDSGQLDHAVFQQTAFNKITQELAPRYGVFVSQDEINSEYARLQRQAGHDSIADTYGLSEEQFKQDIILPDLLSAKLAVWLASNKQLNGSAYRKLAQAQSALSAGGSFDQVASDFSDDGFGAQTGGDLGYVSEDDVFPELYAAFAAAKDSKPHVAYSRLGIHLFEVLGTDNNGPGATARYHVRQIFIKTQDYNAWFASQAKNYKIIKLAQ